jgi:dihydrofolate reductase
MNGLPKHVVSTTLKTLEWSNSRLVAGNVVDGISALKASPGRDLLVYGSRRLVQTLMRHHLVDEYRLMVYPLVLGSGRRLFDEESAPTGLRLVDSRAYDGGVAVLAYVPAGGAAAS